MFLLLSNITLVAQTFEEMDYVVTNRLYEFLIEYEESLNAEVFSRSRTNSFFYNNSVEMYNDLSDNYPSYMPLNQYLEIYDSVKSGNPEFEVFHYNLTMLHNQTRLYYDLIHIQLLKQIIDNSVYDAEIIHIDSSNVISSNKLNFTILYNKFDPENRFKILKIEKANQSYVPSGWHRFEIPDEIKVSLGPVFSTLSGDSPDYDLLFDHKFGFQGNATIANRFAGGLNYSFSWFAGIGATYLKSDWQIESDLKEITGPENDFQTEIQSEDISQELSLFYINIPMGVSARYFPFKKLSFSLNAEIKPWYLLNSSYEVSSGLIDYSGTFTFEGQEFHFTDMPYPYNFIDDVDATKHNETLNIKNFGLNAGLSAQSNYQITDYFDVFIQPSWQTNVTSLLAGDEKAALYDLQTDNRGAVNPLIEIMDDPSFAITSVEVGLIFRLNNTVKPFVPEFKFKENERRDQKSNFYDYLAAKIPEKNYDPPFDKRKKKRVIIIKADEYISYPSNIRYSYGPDLGIEKRYIKTNKINKIRPIRSDIFYFKPFRYDLASQDNSNPYLVNHKVLYDKLSFADSLKKIPVELKMSHLTDLNVFIISNLNSGSQGVRNKIISSYKDVVFKLSENKCALYFNESHGRNIEELYLKSRENKYCFDCTNAFNSVDRLEKNDQDGALPPFGFMNELRILLNKDFNLERRNINLNFLTGDEKSFLRIFDELQNLSKIDDLEFAVWVDPDGDQEIKKELLQLKEEILALPVKIDQFKGINFYYDPNGPLKTEIGDYYYTYIYKDDKEYDRTKANTYKVLHQYINDPDRLKKSIRLRNFEFEEL